ncbi:hypothetical protein D3C85_254690 [compost metagenome]
MTFQNYFYRPDESGDLTSYEEHLLLNYDDYLEDRSVNPLSAKNHYSLEFGELEEDLEDDFESEYDENDWEEEDSSENFEGEYDKNEEDPGTFLMRS